MAGVTRRQLLKLAGSAACAAVLSPAVGISQVFGAELESGDNLLPPPTPLGRVATWGIEIREDSKRKSKLIRTARRDEVLRLYGQATGEAVMPNNATWYKTEDGYAHSAWVQPVEDIKNVAEPDRAAWKFWGEITVPFSDSLAAPDPKARRYMRLYYTSVFRVIGAVMGKDYQWWYRLQDGITWEPGPYVPAMHIRRMDPSELTPLSPGVTDKHIEVNLGAQTITAYENGRPVLTSRVASGYGDNFTPPGMHRVLSKTPASRMTGGIGDDFYDLPGVPFPTYFTQNSAAIHGAYWHNDFGRPRSHGCLNVSAPVARWFWRWTEPSAPYDAVRYKTPRNAGGTFVKVSPAQVRA